MGDNGTLWLPEQASTVAGDVDALFYFIYWVSVVLFIGVMGAMVYFAYRYRRRSEADRPAAGTRVGRLLAAAAECLGPLDPESGA